MAGRRVCVVATQVPYVRGGAELHTERLVEVLRETGHDVETVALPFVWTGDESSLEQALAWRMMNLSAELVGIDLVIATKFPSYLVKHPNKVVWMFHQQREIYDLHATPYGRISASQEDRGLRQALIDLDLQALGEARGLFAISGNSAARMERYCGLQAKPLYAPPKLYEELRPGPFGDYILYVGRLDRIKRIDLTIRALAETNGTYKLLVAGKGPLLAELERTTIELGMRDRVEFLGFVSDEQVIDLYAGCFAAVLNPHDEDYGLTTLEAYFAGKPVITTTDAGGMLEWVEDGVSGFVTEPDPKAIAEKIETLAADRELCRRFGSAGRERVCSEVSWPVVIEALTATLD